MCFPFVKDTVPDGKDHRGKGVETVPLSLVFYHDKTSDRVSSFGFVDEDSNLW